MSFKTLLGVAPSANPRRCGVPLDAIGRNRAHTFLHCSYCMVYPFLHRFENSTNGLFSEVINEKDWWQKLYYTQNIISFAYFQSCFKTGKSHGIGDEDRIPVSIHRRPHIRKFCGIRGI